MIVSLDAEKAFDKIQYLLMIKILSKVGIQGNILNLRKTIYKNATANIILPGEKLETFPLRSGTSQRYSPSSLLFNIIMEVLANAIKQEREIEDIQIGKEDKIYLYMNDDIENLKE